MVPESIPEKFGNKKVQDLVPVKLGIEKNIGTGKI